MTMCMRLDWRRWAPAILALSFASDRALADLADGVNRLRERGCNGRPGIEAPLRNSRGLNEIAREWARGGRLSDAIARAEYRVVNSRSMHVQGSTDEAAILKLIAQSYCE